MVLQVIASVAAFALPAICVVHLFRRFAKEREWQDKLWKDHEAETDKDKRRQIRDEMRDISGISMQSSSQACRQSVIAALMWLIIILGLWLAFASDFKGKPELSWTMVAFVCLGWLGVMILAFKRRDE